MASKKRPARPWRQAGYLAAILAFLVMWWAVGKLSEWDWPPFLTQDVDDVVPWFRLSLAVDIVFNVAFVCYDPRWFRAVGESIRSVASGFVALVVLMVYPFDFTEYSSGWDKVATILLIVAIVGAAITAITYAVKAIVILARPRDDETDDEDASS